MFIVFDSIDGAGKGHQRVVTTDYLAKNTKLKVKGLEFPIHNAFYETVIHPALQQERWMNGASWVLSYLLDKTLQTETMKPYVGNKENVLIADGYFTTTIAYQCYLMEQVSLKKLLQYAKDFEIPRPDFAIFIDADPKVAMERKEIEEGHEEGLDMFEKSLDKQKKLREIYQRMAHEEIYCDWETVNGDGTIEEVTNEILTVLKNRNLV